MKIILIRHGQTKWNREEVFRGRADIPLDETGVAQAEATGAALSHIKITAVYSSPLARANETGRIIARPHGLGVQLVDDLADIDCGAWEGLPVEEARSRYPDMFQAWQRVPHTVTFPGGESLDKVARRAASALDRIAAAHAQGETVAVVSHRVVNKLLLLRVLGLGSSAFWKIRQDTCCLNIIEHGPGGYVLHLLNDRCHLTGGRIPEPPADF
ncbi:MAG: histidine phosphatase family protein [Firmicutes bacterium]|nr:histidine phosphatase family protein [Bacillota bacterium]